SPTCSVVLSMTCRPPRAPPFPSTTLFRSPRLPPGAELPLEDHVNGDARVVGPREPQRVEAVHALHPHEHVLERHVERVAPVQRPGHVRRWHDDRERLPGLRGIASEVAVLLPRGIPAL